MLQCKQSASIRVPVALVSVTDRLTPITGKSGADATVTYVKGDGTTANYPGTGTMTEITANAFAGGGIYQLTVPTAASDVVGPLAWAISVSGAELVKGFIDVVANLASDVKADTAAVKLRTDNLPSDPADQSILAGLIADLAADLSGISVDLSPVLDATDDIYARLGAPAGASIAEDIANISVDTGDLGDLADEVHALFQIHTGRWRIIARDGDEEGSKGRLIFYDEDGVTPLFQFTLQDAEGDPTVVNPFQRALYTPD